MYFQPNDSALLTDTVDAWNTTLGLLDTPIQRIELVVVGGFVSGDLPCVRPGEAKTVGRTGEVDYQTPLDQRMSRKHFSIECDHDGGFIRDLGSTNGTFVNGVSVDDRVEIRDGDQVVAGQTIFTIRIVLA